MSLLCMLVGHKTQEGVHSGAEYMRWISWSVIDGVGRDHRGLESKCSRCGECYVAGKVHMPKPYEEQR